MKILIVTPRAHAKVKKPEETFTQQKSQVVLSLTSVLTQAIMSIWAVVSCDHSAHQIRLDQPGGPL